MGRRPAPNSTSHGAGLEDHVLVLRIVSLPRHSRTMYRIEVVAEGQVTQIDTALQSSIVAK